MFDVIISALLPIAIILLLGYFAGYHQDFNKDQAGILNRMVMLYALPLMLFSGIATSSITEIFEQRDLAVGLFIGMIVFYFVVYFLVRYVFKQNLKMSALLALAIAGPAVPFVGIPVLGVLFGPISSVPISIGSMCMNLIQVPLTIILLSLATNDSADGTTQTVTINKSKAYMQQIVKAIKEPIVWAPILAFIFILAGIKVPSSLISSFELLGKATGGVALFASGIILFSYKVTFNKSVLLTLFSKNLLIPFAIWGITILLGFSPTIIKETVLTMSIPTASVVIILSVQYKEGEQNLASVLFLSTMLSILTMGMFIAILP